WRRLLAAWRARPIIRGARTSGASLLLLASVLRAQGGGDTARTDSIRHDPTSPIGAIAPHPAPLTRPAVPFPVGERLVYGARFGPFSVGGATMEVAGIDTLRGTETVHFVFPVSRGASWGHPHQPAPSWVGRDEFRVRASVDQPQRGGNQW